MKKFQCYNDFKTSIKQENIPSIDEELMINKIYNNLQSKPKYNKLKVASIIFSFILLTTGSIAIAKNLNVNLFNDKGEKVFTLGKLSEEQIKKDMESSANSSNYTGILDDVEKNTKPGEQSLVLIAKEYDIEGYGHSFQNNKYKTIEELKKATSNKFRLPIFPEGLYLSDISANFKVEIDEDFIKNYEIIDKKTNLPQRYGSKYDEYFFEYNDKLYKECIATNKEYIVDTQKLTSDIEYVRLNIYLKNDYLSKGGHAHNIALEINKAMAAMSSDFEENNVEKIKIGDKEAILEKYSSPYATTYDMTYVESCNNENFTYMLRGFYENEKELVIEILKSLQ
jgi:hypothetical protein